MDDLGFFDPLQTDEKHSANENADNFLPSEVEPKSNVANSKSIILEDLVGDFKEEVDEVDGDHTDGIHDKIAKTTTSFFLLDLDTTTTDSTVNVNTDQTANKIYHDDIDKESISEDISDILDINVDNLPVNDDLLEDEEPQSGFFFNDLLDSSSDNIRKTTTSLVSSSLTKTENHDQGDTHSDNSPTFLIGSEVSGHTNSIIEEAKSEENFVAELHDERNENDFQSLLDIEVPSISDSRNKDEHFVREESFVTGIEEFTLSDKNIIIEDPKVTFSDEIKNMIVTQSDSCDTRDDDSKMIVDDFSTNIASDYDEAIAAQLKPVFDMCGPDANGMISITHLKKMCQENGQVRNQSSLFLRNNI